LGVSLLTRNRRPINSYTFGGVGSNIFLRFPEFTEGSEHATQYKQNKGDIMSFDLKPLKQDGEWFSISNLGYWTLDEFLKEHGCHIMNFPRDNSGEVLSKENCDVIASTLRTNLPSFIQAFRENSYAEDKQWCNSVIRKFRQSGGFEVW
jgi:hypothetical protein